VVAAYGSLPRMDVRPFARSDVPFAAGLLAARGNAHPLAAPFDAAAEIEKLLDDGHTGYVTDTGYLIGKVDQHAGWSQYAGHAAADAAIYRHLYRAVSRDWVEAGQRRHAVVMPDGDPVAQEAFANLAFGREHVFALAAVADQPSGPPDPRVAVRRGTPEDYDAVLPLAPLVSRHLSEAPVWAPQPEAYYDTLPALIEEELADDDMTYHLAFVDGALAGFATWEPMPPRIHVPEGAWALSHMAVRPEVRGQGVGRALTLAGLAMLRERGVTVTWSDWRLTNMSAEPYWRTYGWAPYNVRYTRRLEPGPE
jgi:ribosomal protein S18 acetylase RimI-like enzyme